MGATVDTVLTRYQVDAVQAIDQTKRLTEIERGLEGQGASLSRQFGSLEQGLLGFRREQTQQQRTAGFLAREFEGIASAAGLSGNALRGVTGLFVEGIAGGLGFGLALEAFKLSLGALNDYMEESAKRNAELLARTRKSLDDTFATVRDFGRALDSISGKPLSESEKAIRQATDETNEALLKQTRIIEDMKASGARRDMWWGGDSKEYTRAVAELARIRADGERKIAEIVARGGNERRDIAERELRAEEVVQLRRDAANIGRSDRVNHAVLAIRKKLEADLKELDNDRAISDEARETRRVHLEKQADKDIEFERRQHTNKMIDFRFQEGMAHEEAMRQEIEEYAQVRLALQRLTEDEKKRAQQRALEREALQLQQLSVATVAHTQRAITAFTRLGQVTGSQQEKEHKGQQLIMAGLDALGAAVADFTKQNVEALAKQSAVEGIVNTAKGFASLGLAYLGVPGAAASATAYFSAAAMDFAVAGVAAGVAAGMGGGGGGGGSGATGGAIPSGGSSVGTPSSSDGKPPPTINLYFSGRALMTPAEIKRELADLLKEARDSGFTN